MRTREIVAHFFVPADQQAPEAIHPTMRPLHDPPVGFESSLLLERLGLFPPRPDMGGEVTFGQQVPHLVIVIACVQTHPLWVIWGRLRPHDRDTLDGLPNRLEIMAIRPLHGEADRHATAVGEHAALGANLARSVGCLPTCFPLQGVLWSCPYPSRAIPSQSP
jgi:hypothetical protein